ncbi:MAG: hypothetical protein GC164_03560 [Phycisphaera sp.]|nr:hypothetical protein [Phycisphaera sp.]
MTTPTNSRKVTRPGLAAALALMLPLIGVSSVTLADDIKLSGFWINEVTISDITGGMVVYTTSTGAEVRQALSKVEGIRLTADPKLAQAQEAFEANDYAKALPLLESVYGSAKTKWLKSWSGSMLIKAYDKNNKAVRAVKLFVELAEDGTDPLLLANPPVESLQAANDKAKKEIADILEGKSARMKNEDVATALRAMYTLAGGGATRPGAADAVNTVLENAANNADLPDKPAIPMPIELAKDTQNSRDPAFRAVYLGNFEEALKLANEQLVAATPRLSFYLYLKGMAQLGLAEKSGNIDGYKDAGLSFMRVVIYFGKSRTAWIAPSLVEAGYVHLKINRPDIAKTLFDQARNLVDNESEPDYAKRLDKLIEQASTAPGS